MPFYQLNILPLTHMCCIQYNLWVTSYVCVWSVCGLWHCGMSCTYLYNILPLCLPLTKSPTCVLNTISFMSHFLCLCVVCVRIVVDPCLHSVCRCHGTPAGTRICSCPECSDKHPRQHTRLGSHCTHPHLRRGVGVKRWIQIERGGERMKRNTIRERTTILTHLQFYKRTSLYRKT